MTSEHVPALTLQSILSIPRYLGLHDVTELAGDLYRLVLGYTARTRRELELDREGVELMLYFLTPRRLAEAATHLGLSPESMLSVAAAMVEEGVFVEAPTASTADEADFYRYDRHLLFYHLQGADPYAVQRRISQSSVALIGMGGIGNWVSMGLIGAGLKELRLIDFDTIELTNLTRQVLFDESDIGKSKGAVAQQVLSKKNSKTDVRAIELKIEGESGLEEVLKGTDFIVLSADTPGAIHNWLDHVARRLSIPYLNVGYRDGMGVVGPLTLHGRTSCYECFKPQQDEDEATSRSSFMEHVERAFREKYQAPSFGPLNAMVSNIAVMELLKYLGDFGEPESMGTELTVDPITLQIDRKPYQRDPSCWHCGLDQK